MIYIQPDYLKSDIEEMNKIINSITGNNSFTLNDNELNMISSFYDKKVSKYLKEEKEREKDNVSQKNIGDLMGSLLDTYNNDLSNKDMMKDDDKDCKPLDDFISELNRTVENKQNKTPLFMGKDKDGSLII